MTATTRRLTHGTPRAYGLWLAAAFLVFGEMMALQIGAARLPLLPAFAVTAFIVACSVPGARLLYVLSHWPEFRLRPQRIWARGDGGSASFGGILAFYVFGIPVAAMSGLPLGAYLDMVAIAALAAFPFGRLACFVRGCCDGRVGRWPNQLVEIALVGLLLGGLLLLRGSLAPGFVFLLTFSCYASLRFALDFYRDEAVAGRTTAAQRAAALVAAASFATLAITTLSRSAS